MSRSWMTPRLPPATRPALPLAIWPPLPARPRQLKQCVSDRALCHLCTCGAPVTTFGPELQIHGHIICASKIEIGGCMSGMSR